MAYLKADYGPGEIAALEPTIGLTSRVPTIGGEDAGRPIPSMGYVITTVPPVEATPAWKWALGIGAGAFVLGVGYYAYHR